MTDPNIKLSKTDVSVSVAKKEIAIGSKDGKPVLKLTNEYGNSLFYEMGLQQFDRLHATLWQFVKESQH